jgi:hypothetical protein
VQLVYTYTIQKFFKKIQALATTGIQLLYSTELLQERIQLIVPYNMLQLNLIESTDWL